MKKFVAFSVLTLACVSLLWMPTARTAANDEAEIRQLLDRWAKAFRAQYQGAVDVETRDVSITTGDSAAFSHGLERISGTMKNGQKYDLWVRFTECYRKINGHWRATHDHISVPVDLESGKAVLYLKP